MIAVWVSKGETFDRNFTLCYIGYLDRCRFLCRLRWKIENSFRRYLFLNCIYHLLTKKWLAKAMPTMSTSVINYLYLSWLLKSFIARIPSLMYWWTGFIISFIKWFMVSKRALLLIFSGNRFHEIKLSFNPRKTCLSIRI